MKKAVFTACLLLCSSLEALAQQPVVAIHVSELTQGLETTAAGPSTPQGPGTTGNEWWTPSWHYFVMSESVKEALRSDGTPFVVVTDADISAGNLLTVNGALRYPIVISLASEAIRDDELTPLLNYVSAGGFLLAGSSAFTRNPDGTTRGDFALANALGLHMANPMLQNWSANTTFSKVLDHRLISHIPAGDLNWMMPLTSEDTPWGLSVGNSGPPGHVIQPYHYVWQVNDGDATVLATTTAGLPYLAVKHYGSGYFIYDAAMQPLIGSGGYAPGMYAYGIFRNAIEWAFESVDLPIVKLSPWPYQYNAAYLVRHDFENFQSSINSIETSAQIDNSFGAKGDYYFCTGTLRVEMGNSPSTIASLQRAVTLYGATIGSHNGGLPNPSNSSLLLSDYDYWHWGPDEALDFQPPGFLSGSDYASTSIGNSLNDIAGWMVGINTNTHTFVAPYFNGTREGSYQVLDQLGIITSGDQKLSPFPHWTVSTQTQGKRYGFVSLPVSDWYIGSTVGQSMEAGHTTSSIDALVDYYYGLGGLINLYMHQTSNNTNPREYIQHSAAEPNIWAVNAATVYGWWRERSPVQVVPTYTIANNRLTATATITGASDPNTAIELVIPNWATVASGLQVKLNGATADPSSYRVYHQGIKVNVGTSVSTVEVSFPFVPAAQGDSYQVTVSNLTVSAPGVLGNDSNPGGGSMTAVLASPAAHGSVNLSPDGSFTYTPNNGFSGIDSFTYQASASGVLSNVASVTIMVLPSGGQVMFLDDFSGQPGADPFWVTVLGTWSVVNGTMQGSSAATSYGMAYANGNWTDYSVQAKVQFPAGAFGGGIGGRVNTSTGAHYAAWVYPEGSPGGSTLLRLIKFQGWTAWSGTPMAQVSLPSVGTASHTLLLSFQGNGVQVSYDGTQYINVADNGFDSLPAYTNGAISLDMWTFTTPYVMTVDDVVVQTSSSPTPTAVNDSFTIGQSATLSVSAPGVLANDSGGAGSTATLVTGPSNGTLTLNSDGSFTYTPTSTFSGPDSFTYREVSGGAQSNVATVAITVTASISVQSVAVNPTSVAGGSSSTGTVTLTGSVTSAVTVNLSSGNSAVASVPSTATVAANSSTATFNLTTVPVGVSTPVSISATYNTTGSTTLTVNPPSVSTVSLNPTNVQGGTSSTGTVTLSSAAPSTGAVVSLSSSDTTAAQVPSTVTVAGGATTATFTVTTTPVSAVHPVSISATYAGSSKSGSLTVNPPSLTSVTLNPSSVVGGTSATGTVTLSSVAPTGGTTVTLSSSNTTAARVPASVTVTAGRTTATFTVTTSPVVSTTTVTITGVSVATQTQNLTVNPPSLFSVGLNPTSVTGGNSSTGTATLNGAAPTGGLTVSLSSGDPNAQVPLGVFIPAGSTSATFTVTTTPVASLTTATITGVYGATQTRNLTINPPTLSSLGLNPTSVVGGGSSTGTVTLNGPAPSGGAIVSLSSSNTNVAQAPATVTVPAGNTTATFTVTTSVAASTTSVTISGVYGASRSQTLTVSPPAITSLSLNPILLVGGHSSIGTVTLGLPSPAGGIVVSLSSSKSQVVQVPNTVTVPAGANSVTFGVTTGTVKKNWVVTISARLAGTSKSATLTVTP
jgi:hypothetical protein